MKLMPFCVLTALSLCGLADSSSESDESVLSLSLPRIQDGKVEDNVPEDRLVNIYAKLAGHVFGIENETGRVSFKERIRGLAIGDFDDFNNLFRNAIVRLPDAEVNQRVIGINLNLKLGNIRCTGIEIGDIVIDYRKENSRRMNVDVDIMDLDMDCSIDYRYEYGFLHGSGSVQGYTSGNSASTRLVFNSANFDEHPPHSSSIEGCISNVEINDMNFR
jgi:hypothetical protein